MFDFKNTEAAKGVSYMTPGVYALKPVKVELGAFPKGTKYLGITFENEDEVQITEKFVLSEKAIGRLQYLHEGFFGKKCEKQFKSEGEVEAYFRKALTTKEIVKNIIIGGEISGANVYASFPYTNFIDEEGALELGEFEEGSEEWKKYVKKRANATSEVADQGNGLLNSDDDDDEIGVAKKEKGTKEKVEEKAKVGKGKKEKEPVAAGDDDDDSSMPW
jgi:hypothetical protein